MSQNPEDDQRTPPTTPPKPTIKNDSNNNNIIHTPPKRQQHKHRVKSPVSAPVFHRMKSGIEIWSEAQKSSSFGRAPWYGGTRKRRSKETLLIGVAGGTASGKTSVCKAVISQLNLPWVQILSLDCFYKVLTPAQIELANKEQYNFDHPDAFDWKLLERVMTDIKHGLAVNVPIYDFNTHSRLPESTLMYGADVVLCEGILTLYNSSVRDMFDVKVFVNTDDDIRLIRRIRRDRKERGRSIESILDQYEKTVKPSYESFCLPSQSYADVIIPRGKDNVVAIGLLVDHIRHKLMDRGVLRANLYETAQMSGRRRDLPLNVKRYKEDREKKGHRGKNNGGNSGKSVENAQNGGNGNNRIKLIGLNEISGQLRLRNVNSSESGVSMDKSGLLSEIGLDELFDKLFDINCKGLGLLQIVDTLSRELLTMVRSELIRNGSGNSSKNNSRHGSGHGSRRGSNGSGNGSGNGSNSVQKQLDFGGNDSKNKNESNKTNEINEINENNEMKKTETNQKNETKNEKNEKKQERSDICAVSIIRGGLIFENGLKLAFGDSEQNMNENVILRDTQGKVGKKQTKTTTNESKESDIKDENNSNNSNNSNNNELMTRVGSNYILRHGTMHITHEQNNPELPRFFKCQLPSNINECNYVIVFDALMGTGNRARMALQVLLDHHVPEENIYFVCLVSSRAAVATLARFFPNTHFISGMIDERLESSHWTRIDGISSLVLRYFDAVGIKMDAKDQSAQIDI